MKQIKFFDPGKTFTRLKDELLPAIEDVLTRGDLILRDDLEKFEEEFARYVGTKYAVGVANGTDALVLSLQALGIGEGDEVVVPSYAFRATVEAVHRVGATPVLADLGEDWSKYRTDKTRAIIPAHIAGETLDWTPDGGIIMVEDACQAVGVKPVEGKTACYSFYPAKLLGCFGDGGAIATNDAELAEELKDMRNHYKATGDKTGYNSRLDNLQAAVLRIKLRELPKDIAKRKLVADKYNIGLTDKINRPLPRKVYQDYIIECKNQQQRDNLYSYLSTKGVETMKNGYPFPKKYPKKPQAEAFENRTLRIPCHQELEHKEVMDVMTAINSYYEG